MSSRQQISMSREEEGSYHRREVSDCAPRQPATGASTTYRSERYLVPKKPSSISAAANYSSDDEPDRDNFEEWTTSKRKVNHTTRQVETRVSRQLLVEDGKVIADSGPQVTTRIKEDNKVEECEKEKAPKQAGGRRAFESAFGSAPEAGESAPSNGRVLGEKKEIQRVSREVREENMQYHDERLRELSGRDVHRRAIKAPHELLSVHDEHERHSAAGAAPRGKMVHYSNKGKKYQDTDEILEVAKLAIDGSVTKEVKRTRHHEEFSEDEKPDEKGEAEALRAKPVVERSSRRHVDYVNDFDDTATPESSDAEGAPASRGRPSASSKQHRHDDQAFPRYQIDPLLNSLRDEDFQPTSSANRKPVVVRQRDESSSDEERAQRPTHRGHGGSVNNFAGQQVGGAVEVPEEYRVNKQRLMSGRSSSGARSKSPVFRQVPRQQQQQQQQRRRQTRREDASVQARLTDEESEELNAHEKTARYLQRQSTPDSARHYYYGQQKQKQKAHKQRAQQEEASSSSDSFSSLERAKQRQSGAQSRDSGFRSPAQRAQTPAYSISSGKHKTRLGAVSPTPSAGQRSVKTTTTTMSAGLRERPLSPEPVRKGRARGQENEEEEEPQRPKRAGGGQQRQQAGNKQLHHRVLPADSDGRSVSGRVEEEEEQMASASGAHRARANQSAGDQFKRRQRRSSPDTISISSLKSPNATKIKVPYMKVIEVEHDEREATQSDATGEMSLREDIEILSKRLARVRNTNEATKHFDYKTVVAKVEAKVAPAPPSKPQIIGAYNVQIVQQKSPFLVEQQQVASSFAQSLTKDETTPDSGLETSSTGHSQILENNNDASFSLDQHFKFKYRAVPALVEPSVLLGQGDLLERSGQNGDENDDCRSQTSSAGSLQSSKTYQVRRLTDEQGGAQQVASPVGDELESSNNAQVANKEEQAALLEASKSPAWIYNPRDGSSTTIAPPPKPQKPPVPEVQTEELVQTPGGRSYYLELIEKVAKVTEQRQQQDSPKGSLYSRWTSQGALNNREANLALDWGQTTSRINLTKETKPKRPSDKYSTSKINSLVNSRPLVRKQLPSGVSANSIASNPSVPNALWNRSKSSSCLLNSTKPSKYSIYGGFRKPGDTNKPVPRLSYSRAIGPRSQRQIDAQPKIPSRYLKMK